MKTMREWLKSNIVDVALIAGIAFLAYHNKDGWGWLTFVLIIRN